MQDSTLFFTIPYATFPVTVAVFLHPASVKHTVFGVFSYRTAAIPLTHQFFFYSVHLRNTIPTMPVNPWDPMVSTQPVPVPMF